MSTSQQFMKSALGLLVRYDVVEQLAAQVSAAHYTSMQKGHLADHFWV